MPVIDLSEGEVKDLIAMGGLVLVEFYNPNCKFCQQMVPVVEDISAGDDIRVARFRPEKGSAFAKEHNLRVTPTWVTFRDGKKVNEHAGLTTKDVLLKLFDPSFKPPSPPKPRELFVLSLGSLLRVSVGWLPGKLGTLRLDLSFRTCRSCFE